MKREGSETTVPALLLVSCVNLGKVHNLSQPWFNALHVESIYIIRHHSMGSINGNYFIPIIPMLNSPTLSMPASTQLRHPSECKLPEDMNQVPMCALLGFVLQAWNHRQLRTRASALYRSFCLTVWIFLKLFLLKEPVPGSSPGGSREFEAGTASARIRKQLLN